MLLYLIPADAPDVKKQFAILRNELQTYNPELLDKNYMVVLSKCDLLDEELQAEYAIELKNIFGDIPHAMISSVGQMGLQPLKDMLWQLLADNTL